MTGHAMFIFRKQKVMNTSISLALSSLHTEGVLNLFGNALRFISLVLINPINLTIDMNSTNTSTPTFLLNLVKCHCHNLPV